MDGYNHGLKEKKIYSTIFILLFSFLFFTENLPTPISTDDLYYRSSMCVSPDVDLTSECSTIPDGTKLVYKSMPRMFKVFLFLLHKTVHMMEARPFFLILIMNFLTLNLTVNAKRNLRFGVSGNEWKEQNETFLILIQVFKPQRLHILK